ncbi:MAG TPA: peptide-methionine (R)-S-oxide reductase MsrB [Casimicrobiaceae bacterium]|nr:peptide-methionine (R)-S-oxide reductase MsrB [Casimicrobiaceae bacterium]
MTPRRRFLSLMLAAPLLQGRVALAQRAPAGRTIEQMRADWRSFVPAGAKLPAPDQALKLEPAEWRKRLTPAAFDVLREEGTERAFTSPLNDEKRRGVFVCAGCELPLFTSEMKFDSGTGWPSFFTTIPGVFAMKKDFKIFHVRDEYHCIRCGGHHGHVFDDGPPPTGQRWCNNGVALKFLPA